MIINYLGDYPLYVGIQVKTQQTVELIEIYCLGHYLLCFGI